MRRRSAHSRQRALNVEGLTLPAGNVTDSGIWPFQHADQLPSPTGLLSSNAVAALVGLAQESVLEVPGNEEVDNTEAVAAQGPLLQPQPLPVSQFGPASSLSPVPEVCNMASDDSDREGHEFENEPDYGQQTRHAVPSGSPSVVSTSEGDYAAFRPDYQPVTCASGYLLRCLRFRCLPGQAIGPAATLGKSRSLGSPVVPFAFFFFGGGVSLVTPNIKKKGYPYL